MLKRYVVFITVEHENAGGWGDVLRTADGQVASFDKSREAIDAAEHENKGQPIDYGYHVIDLHTGAYVHKR